MPRFIKRNNGTMARISILDLDRRMSLDSDLVWLDVEVNPLAAVQILTAVTADFFYVQILRVSEEHGEAPRDPIVVSDRYTREVRLHGANHVPTRRVQVHELAQ